MGGMEVFLPLLEQVEFDETESCQEETAPADERTLVVRSEERGFV